MENTQNTQNTLNENNEKSFRISAKRMLLTYSQVGTEFTTNNILEQLQYKLGRFSYIISKEEHTDGGTHFHALLIHRTKFNIKKPYTLDLEIDGHVAHGNYKPINNLDSAVHYVCKFKQYITNLQNLQDGMLLDSKEFVLKRAQEIGFEKALLEYTRKFPKKAFSGSSVSSLIKNFKDIQQLLYKQEDDVLESPFQMEHFNLKGVLKKWANDPQLYLKKAVIIIGEAGIGKTEFAKVFCLAHKWKTLSVSHKEDFQRIDSSYDAIIIDDANFNEFSDTQKLALLENSVPKTIRVLYQTVRKKKGVVMMILMNHIQFRQVYKLFDQKAFARRVVIAQPEKPFMINVNINIQHNTHNHNHNGDINYNNNAFQKHQQDEKQLIQDNIKRSRDIIQNAQFED